MLKLTQQEMDKRAAKIGIKLLDPYQDCFTKTRVQCQICGHVWKKLPTIISQGYGCPSCFHARNRKDRRLSHKEASKRASNVGVTLLEPYQGQLTKIKTQCKSCGHIWKALPDRRRGCPQCAVARQRLSQTEVSRRAARVGVKLLELYKNQSTKIRVQCQTCGHTWRRWPLSNHGCPKCGREKANSSITLSSREATKRANESGVKFLEPYKNVRTKIKTQCKICKHIWKVSPHSIFYDDGGCPVCYPLNFGVSEAKVRKILEALTGWKFPKATPNFLKGRNGRCLELDGYNPRHQIAFEYQGYQHYHIAPQFGVVTKADLAELKKRDERKRVACYYHGVLLIRVPYFKKNVRGFIKKKLVKAGLL